MFRHYFKLAFRDIIKKGFYSVVIIFSLAIGLTCSNYIVAFIVNEFSVDGFHSNKDRIFRLLADDPWEPGNKMSYIRKEAPEIIKSNYPEVQDYCETRSEKVNKIKVGSDIYYEGYNALAVSNSFLNIFTYPFVSGNPRHALDSKEKIVITQKLARKFFGDNPPVGQEITIFFRSDTIVFNVSGIIKDMSSQSHLKIDMLIPLVNFQFEGSRIYLLLGASSDASKLEVKMSDDRENIPIIYESKPGVYTLQNLKSIYFDTSNKTAIENSRARKYIYIISAIGLIILTISLLNYLNLLVSRLIDKRREFAVNKILGSKNSELLYYFLVEFGILIFISYDLSIIFTRLLFPYFNHLTNASIRVGFLFDPKVVLCSLGILLIIGCVTMMYLSFMLSRQKSADWISLSDNPEIKKKSIPLLVVIQFTISIVLIISTMTIARQLYYIYNRNIGLDRNVVELHLPYSYRNQSHIFKESLLQNPLIVSASICAASPLMEHALILLHYDKNDKNKTYSPAVFFGDEDFIKTLNIKLLAGRDFSAETDGTTPKCIINKSLSAMFDLDDPIGQKLPGADDEIIGLAEDFNFQSLENVVAPGYIAFSTNKKNSNIIIKINREDYQAGIRYVGDIWNKLIPDYPFNYKILGDQFDQMHAESGKFFGFIITFSIISLLITMIGLLALTVYSTRSRTKEIGIRKVNGAGSGEIIQLLIRDYAKWMLIAVLIAFPAAYIVMIKWLQNFVYRINLAWWIFAAAAVITFMLVLITIFRQSWLVARKNPVESLRYE